MSLGPEFYAGLVAEYGSDVKTFADAFQGCVKRGDKVEAQILLTRMAERAWRVTSNAETALEQIP